MAEAPPGFAPTLGTFGTTGLIDMPTGESQRDAEITTTMSYFKGGLRTTLSFQITPRLSGSFRYSKIRDFFPTAPLDLYDRSFDISYRVLDEGKYLPSLTIGLRDFIGTGVYAGEYIAATKHLHPSLKATLGLGWGRLGGADGFSGRTVNVGVGGVPDAGNWFRGPTALFGGLEWQTPVKGLNLKLEYSSDAYVPETVQRSSFSHRSKINLGADYRLSRTTRLSAYYLYGTEVGVQVSFALNPKESTFPSGREGAALPVAPRPVLNPGERYDIAWAARPQAATRRLAPSVKTLLEATGLELEAVKIDVTTARLYIRNETYPYPAEALGRAARALSRALPASVETFEIIPVENGLPLSATKFSRAALEALEHDPDGAAKLLAASAITATPGVPHDAYYAEGLYPKLTWSLRPYIRGALFDPDSPVRAEAGIRLRAGYDIAPGLSLSGSIIKPIGGNLDKITRASNSVLPHVRSDSALYFRQGDPALERLSADYLFKLAPELYGRVSLGYLETMYGGISTELLWKPVNSRFALGVELNYVRQRDFDQRLGFQNYDIVTGHISAYADLTKGFTAQIDAGRYLAGDWGATFSLNRTFLNGWKVGAFFTLTDVPFNQFGEGSFDKGITMSIPFSAAFGTPSRKTADITIRPLTRDGGARLSVQNRLYPIVSGYDQNSIAASFGRVWR
ncbi:MAG: YjbH domain-containing protein [Gammaproteobacteria bacterium]|nr:YjbH domain-containing protein [Gammaproteobacteria bacterium]